MQVCSFNNYKNAFLQKEILEALEQTLSTFNNTLPEDGVYPLENGARAIVQRYNSKDFSDVKYEDHEIMTDIQFVLQGEEYAYITDTKGMTPITYKSEEERQEFKARDIEFYNEKPQEYARVILNTNTFCVIYPKEAHASNIKINESQAIVKVVVKVPLSK